MSDQDTAGGGPSESVQHEFAGNVLGQNLFYAPIQPSVSAAIQGLQQPDLTSFRFTRRLCCFFFILLQFTLVTRRKCGQGCM